MLVFGILGGYPSTDSEQQVLKMGLGQPEIALEVPSFQAQLQEKVVKSFKLAARLESLMDPDAATSAIIFHLPQKV